MEFIEIAKLVAEVGFPIVCSGIFLYLAVRMYKKQQEWLDNFIKNAGSVPRHPSTEETEALAAINNKIYQEARGLRNALDADRTYVVLYHNGGSSSSGLFFQKMSCICEVVSSGILPVSNQLQNLHRSSYSIFCDQLKEKHTVVISNVENIKSTDGFLYQQMTARHAYSSAYRVLKDEHNAPIGFIGIEYCALNEKVSTEKTASLLKTVALKVASLVDVRSEVV